MGTGMGDSLAYAAFEHWVLNILQFELHVSTDDSDIFLFSDISFPPVARPPYRQQSEYFGSNGIHVLLFVLSCCTHFHFNNSILHYVYDICNIMGLPARHSYLSLWLRFDDTHTACLYIFLSISKATRNTVGNMFIRLCFYIIDITPELTKLWTIIIII